MAKTIKNPSGKLPWDGKRGPALLVVLPTFIGPSRRHVIGGQFNLGFFFFFFWVFFFFLLSWWLLWLLVAPGGSWWLLRLLVAPGGSWWLLVAPGGFYGSWLLELLAPMAHLSSIDQSISEACSPGACCALDTP